jgi:hypothetical protein
MFSLRDYLIKIAENTGCTISYDEKWVSDMTQEIYRASLTWAKGMKMRDIMTAMQL